ncbi:LOW QUALITY PROTEIN: zinc finger and BTB domain-containing protein 26-like [Scomber scombrus]|uniref:LOW QUALITY PROTEIN: zinc finger and BTB domain-containing protein 26-like n=1 Tax=Scomber scombrus TaxID=13677 RepID=A0AAV1NM19_SCOSC
MSSSPETLHFSFPAHGDSIFRKMNALREHRRFCDVTLLLGCLQGTTVQPLHFHGHRVVLAASSDFLRDQFLLHEGQAELNVGVVSSVEVGKRLLLSCYTGLLEVPLKELVIYLTAASVLQMSQVVEECAQAVSQYLVQPKNSWPGINFNNLEEIDAAQPSTSIQESTEEGGAALVHSKSRASQGVEDSQGLREVIEDRKVIKAKIKISEDIVSTFGSLESEEGGNIQAADKNSPSYQMFSPGAQLEEGRELIDSNIFCLSREHPSQSHFTGDELTEDTGSILVQRPYLCRRCDKVFQHLESYVGHLKELRQYLCLVCEKSFSLKSNLTCHVHVHTGVKNFRCPLCHKTFLQTARLQDHLNVHTGDKPHKCNYCAVHFPHKPDLRRHLKVIHGKSSLQNVLEETLD